MFGTSLDTVFQLSGWIFNTFFHQCIAVIFIYAIWVPIESYSNQLSWHVILSTLGILPFMIEALILFSNSNVWSQEILKRKKNWIHAILMFLGSFFTITGISVEMARKASSGVPHFQSAHAIVGLIAMIFIIFALVCGPMAFSTSILSRWISPVWLKLTHNIIGQLAYILAVVCLILGYYTDWFSRHTSKVSRDTATVVTVLIMLWSLFWSCRSVYNLIKSIIKKV